MHKGSRLCGAVAFNVIGDMRPAIACHCTQCRKTSGHYWSATEVPTENLRLTKDTGLQWYRSSDKARRGFCNICGSSLFWEPDMGGTTSIGCGTLSLPTGLSTQEHIYMADKGDYYDINDGLPQLEQE